VVHRVTREICAHASAKAAAHSVVAGDFVVTFAKATAHSVVAGVVVIAVVVVITSAKAAAHTVAVVVVIAVVIVVTRVASAKAAANTFADVVFIAVVVVVTRVASAKAAANTVAVVVVVTRVASAKAAANTVAVVVVVTRVASAKAAANTVADVVVVIVDGCSIGIGIGVSRAAKIEEGISSPSIATPLLPANSIGPHRIPDLTTLNSPSLHPEQDTDQLRIDLSILNNRLNLILRHYLIIRFLNIAAIRLILEIHRPIILNLVQKISNRLLKTLELRFRASFIDLERYHDRQHLRSNDICR
jgi:hypothetical protein